AARISGPQQTGDGMAVFEFQFGAEDPAFAGHFPSHPLLPGVLQLEMARVAAEWLLNRSLRVREIGKAKFQRPILPSEVVRVELKWSETGGMIRTRADFSVSGHPAAEMVMTL